MPDDLRERLTALADKWDREAEAGQAGTGHGLLMQTYVYDRHAAELRALLAATDPAPDEALAKAWDEGLQAGENFEAARWAGVKYGEAGPRPALTALNPYRAPTPPTVAPSDLPAEPAPRDRIEVIREGRRNCLEAWPDAYNGDYNPACCRFPKSCSIDDDPDAALTCGACGAQFGITVAHTCDLPVATGDAASEPGLEARYDVRKINDPTGKHNHCRYFVLDPQHDPTAREALALYAARTPHDALRQDLRDWLDGSDGNVHNHPPYRPVCNERQLPDGRLRGACLPNEHFYAWVSPAGTSHAAHLCMTCGGPDPTWLNSMPPVHADDTDAGDEAREGEYDHEPCCGPDCQSVFCTDCLGTGHPHAPLHPAPVHADDTDAGDEGVRLGEALAVELHEACPFGNEHIARLVNYKTGDKIAACPECYDIALIVAESLVLRDALAAETRRGEGVVEVSEDD